MNSFSDDAVEAASLLNNVGDDESFFSLLHGSRVASFDDFDLWSSVSASGVTGTDASSLSGVNSFSGLLKDKVIGSSFEGNSFTAYGNAREPVITSWVGERFGVGGNSYAYSSSAVERHLATPDGLGVVDGEPVLLEIKTTSKPFNVERLPLRYLSQVWWQQYVLGVESSLFVWEEHKDFVPVGEPMFTWVYSDDEKIKKLVNLADEFLMELDSVSA